MDAHFDESSRRAVAAAQEEARRRRHRFIGTEHLLLGLLSASDPSVDQLLREQSVDVPALRRRIGDMIGDGLDVQALAQLGISLDGVREAAERSFGPGALDGLARDRPAAGHLPVTRRAAVVLTRTAQAAQRFGHPDIRPEHLLLAIVNDNGGVAITALRDTGVDLAALTAHLTEQLGPNAA